MEISGQEYWSGLHFLLQGTFPTQGSNSHFLHWQAKADWFFTTETSGENPPHHHFLFFFSEGKFYISHKSPILSVYFNDCLNKLAKWCSSHHHSVLKHPCDSNKIPHACLLCVVFVVSLFCQEAQEQTSFYQRVVTKPGPWWLCILPIVSPGWGKAGSFTLSPPPSWARGRTAVRFSGACYQWLRIRDLLPRGDVNSRLDHTADPNPAHFQCTLATDSNMQIG